MQKYKSIGCIPSNFYFIQMAFSVCYLCCIYIGNGELVFFYSAASFNKRARLARTKTNKYSDYLSTLLSGRAMTGKLGDCISAILHTKGISTIT